MKQLRQMGNPAICPAIAIVKEGKLLIGLRHYTPDTWQAISVWTIPGGRCDEGEPIEIALRREVAEEVGIGELEITDFLGEVPGAKEGDVVHLFAGTTTEEPQLLEPEKFSEWKWENPSAIPENFINPRALALIRNFLRK